MRAERLGERGGRLGFRQRPARGSSKAVEDIGDVCARLAGIICLPEPMMRHRQH
jgi:hypothetical protein